jgi:hypothetical protein
MQPVYRYIALSSAVIQIPKASTTLGHGGQSSVHMSASRHVTCCALDHPTRYLGSRIDPEFIHTKTTNGTADADMTLFRPHDPPLPRRPQTCFTFG